MRSFAASSVSSIARGLCSRGASTLNLKKVTAFITIYAFLVISMTGCGGGGGSTGGSVQKGTQTIAFTQPTSPITYVSGLTVSLSATASSGLPVDLTVDSTSTGKGTISGNTLKVTTAGKFVIDGNQDGNSSYYAAAQTQVSIVVNQATPTVSAWPTASAIASGQALSASTLTGGAASISGKFAWTAPTTVPTAGTDSESVTFTPTDTTDYTSVTADVSIVVNLSTPQLKTFTIDGGDYAVEDNFSNVFIPDMTTCPNCESGDSIFVTTASGTSTATLTSAETTIPGIVSFNGLNSMPQFVGEVGQRGGVNGNNIWAPFLGPANQSTLAISATTTTQFEINQRTGEIDTRTLEGKVGTLFPPCTSLVCEEAVTQIATDDGGNIALLSTETYYGPSVDILDETGKIACSFFTGGTFISSVAASGGYVAVANPGGNLIGISKINCTGYTTLSIAGQPWAVTMVGTNIYVFSRDAGPKGFPRLTKIDAVSASVEGFVDLPNIPTITSIRETTPHEGIDAVAASKQTDTAFALFMSDKTDGVVLTISTDTSNGKVMSVAHATQISDLPVAIAVQEDGGVTKPILWVGYIPADSGGDVMNVGALDPATGDYTPSVGACSAGLIGGFAASKNGLQCAGADTISTPLDLPYGTY